MMLIGKTANWLLRRSVQRCDRSRRLVCVHAQNEIRHSVKVAVVLVDVDLPYWTSKVEHLVAFAATVNNICTAHAPKRLFMKFRCKFRHRHSIRRPRFPIGVQKFGDLGTFCVDFSI